MSCSDKDILSAMLKAQQNGASCMTDQMIKDNCMLLFIAGVGTVSNVLISMLYLLTTHPQIEQRVISEVRELGSRPSLESLQNHRHLNAVIRETLRLYPNVPRINRTIVSSTRFPSGMELPAGTTIVNMIYFTHRDIKVWGPDANQFRPERWNNFSPEQERLIDKSYHPFGYGKHTCLGKNLSSKELLISLFVLYSRFRFKMAPGFEPELSSAFSLEWHNGMQLIPIPINQSELI